MSKIEGLQAGALLEASASPGIVRHLAFKGEGYRVLRSRSDPGMISGWHHHGDYDVYAYVASGYARMEDKMTIITLSPLNREISCTFLLTLSIGRSTLPQRKEMRSFYFFAGRVPWSSMWTTQINNLNFSPSEC